MRGQESTVGPEADRLYCWLCVLPEQTLSMVLGRLGKMFRPSPGWGSLKALSKDTIAFFAVQENMALIQCCYYVKEHGTILSLFYPKQSCGLWVLVSCLAQWSSPSSLLTSPSVARLSLCQAQQDSSGAEQGGQVWTQMCSKKKGAELEQNLLHISTAPLQR